MEAAMRLGIFVLLGCLLHLRLPSRIPAHRSAWRPMGAVFFLSIPAAACSSSAATGNSCDNGPGIPLVLALDEKSGWRRRVGPQSLVPKSPPSARIRRSCLSSDFPVAVGADGRMY
jgi:hypothetical protein